MMNVSGAPAWVPCCLALAVAACSDPGSDDAGERPPVEVENPLTNPAEGPPAGNLEGGCDVPADAGLGDVTSPTRVVGTGTPESCTSEAVVAAVAEGGVITFDCGPDPVTIMLEQTAKIFNDSSAEIVIDGGVTLTGGV